MITIKTQYMNLAALAYSVLLLVSCGNNPKETTNNTSQNKTTIIETEVKNTSTTEKVLETAVLEKEMSAKEVVVEETIKDSKKEILNKTEMVKMEEKKIPEATTVLEDKMETKETTVTETITESTAIEEEIIEVVEEKTTAKKVVALDKLSHGAWNSLLKKYVDSKGNVDYGSFKNDEAALQSYLDYLAKNRPANSSPKNERLAYYINLYNAATVKLILNNYPTKSIKSIKGPWSKKWVNVGDEVLSLGNIEHKILRKMNEPRIHFAINCASYSCPKLVNSAFTAANMEQELEEATKDFVNDTTRNQFGEKTKLSEIFKWYKGDFTDNGTVLEYIAKYSNKDINIKSKIGYLDYDWSLNEAK